MPNDIVNNIKALLTTEPHLTKDMNLLVIRYWMKIEGAKAFADALNCTSARDIINTFDILINTKPGKGRQTYLDL